MRAWHVIGESSAESRFEALRSDTTPLVGRDEEIELLLRRWAAGEGRQWSGGTDLGRARDRQVAPGGGAG